MKLTKLYVLFTALFLNMLCINSVQASDIVVTVKNRQCSAIVAGQEYQCSFGRSGVSSNKIEGDGTTPLGTFALRQILIRPDKIVKNNLKYVSLPIQMLKPTDGWCDDPKSNSYNQLVDLNNFDHSVSHEKLYRDDDWYNIVLVVGYNDAPAVPGKGSAVFVRVAAPDYAGTAGGLGFSQADLLKILAKLDENSKLIVKNAF